VKANILPIVGSLIGALMYLAVTAAVLIKGYKPPKPPASKTVKVTETDTVGGSPYAGKTAEDLPKEQGPSWDFYNADIDELVTYLHQASNTFQLKKKELDELGQRIAAERAELASVTQSVVRLREEIDRHLIQIQGDEAANVKRLAKTYAGMEPASVAKVFAELDEKFVVKIMSQMKDDQNGLVLDALAKTDAQRAKLAASLSDKLRLVPTAKKP
jgi:flagellar motility protein MotE (MotC chaperone)